MVSSAKDIQLRELKDTISQLNTMMSEQTKLIRSNPEISPNIKNLSESEAFWKAAGDPFHW